MLGGTRRDAGRDEQCSILSQWLERLRVWSGKNASRRLGDWATSPLLKDSLPSLLIQGSAELFTRLANDSVFTSTHPRRLNHAEKAAPGRLQQSRGGCSRRSKAAGPSHFWPGWLMPSPGFCSGLLRFTIHDHEVSIIISSIIIIAIVTKRRIE